MDDSKKNLWGALQDLSDIQEDIEQQYNEDAKALWDSLSVDNQMLLFYYVVRQIADAELKDDFESYRTILYSRFGFPSESYQVGMMCRFMELHNSILKPSEKAAYREFYYERLKNAKERTDN